MAENVGGTPTSQFQNEAMKELKAPYAAQDVNEIANLLRTLETAAKDKKKAGFSIKKTRFAVNNSPEHIEVDSWRLQDWDYKRPDLPIYARGLFTTKSRNRPQIAVRGYDKFFNVGEVYDTRWQEIERNTQGSYELTLKENGCIIFISGLDDDTLLVCSKHSTGDRSDIITSHARAGEKRLEAQLEKLGKTPHDLARELRKRNVTAVAELCDDTFEEHILAYGPDKAGLYLHGINLNLPEFTTYASPLVQQFAKDWGFVETGLIVMDDVAQVRKFLEDAAETGAYGGRDVEGFVIRCKRSALPGDKPWQDWFFKYKFEEPYLLYRQWRECTKALIAGRQPKYKKHKAITEEYLLYARKCLKENPKLGQLYNQNHGIIKLRDDFLEYKNLKGSDAAAFEALYGEGAGDVRTEVDRNVILVPIATIGCGKTTIGLALTHLFGFGHIQNDNITGAKRPPRFTKAVLDQLADHDAVYADRNNALRHERKQILMDVKAQHLGATMVCLNFVHNDVDGVRQVTRERVLARGDNHQTIHAAQDPGKFIRVMDGFIDRFEPCDSERQPDDGFDAIIDLDPTADSRTNLETVVNELHRIYPSLIKNLPTSEDMDAAIQSALSEYNPSLKHTIPDRGGKKSGSTPQAQKKPEKKKPLEYMSVSVPTKDITSLLEKTFHNIAPEKAHFYRLLSQTRRIQPAFHVTLMHRASAPAHSELWSRYVAETEAVAPGASLAECEVLLERVVFGDRIMAIVVRLLDEEGRWECVNKVAHITVGTAGEHVKPKESNDLLAKWLEEGASEENKIVDVPFEERPVLKGEVKGVLSR